MALDPISYKKAKDAEKLAQSVIDGEFDLGVARTKIDEKLNDLEQEYAPQLNEVTAQLAQTVEEINLAISEVTQDSEVIMARGGETTLGVRLDKMNDDLSSVLSAFISDGDDWEVEQV